MTVTTGLETLLDDPAAWVQPDQRVGLLSNPTGVDRRLRSTIDLIHAHRGMNLTRLFGPEHGIRGDAQAGVPVDDSTDPRTGLPVTSLYAKDRAVSSEAFASIDVLLIDIQDAGVRYYTYLASANSAARRATEAGAQVIVLDRPNPIGWMGVFGNRVPPGQGSIVGLDGLPIAHGATIGEMLSYLARRDGRALPDVIPVSGWRRSMRWAETGLPWVPPSPNLPTLASIHVYPASCLIEGTSLSEGRGTTLPFEVIGHPDLDAQALADDLNALGLPGYRFRPTTFVPTFSKHEGTLCQGIQIHHDGGHNPAILAFGPRLLELARRHTGGAFEWIRFGDVHFIDRLGGGPELRETIDAGASIDDLIARWTSQTDTFIDDIGQDLIYGTILPALAGV